MRIIRFKFRKTEAVKYISHLEMMKVFMRAIRRSGLKASYTKGFNPSIKMVFALPLPLGVSSDSEYVDIWFDEDYDDLYVMRILSEYLPPGIVLLMSFTVEKSSLMEDVGSAIYFFKVQPEKHLKQSLDTLIRQDSIIVERSEKKGPVDILPYIYKIDYHDETSFSVLCKAGAKGNLQPRLFLQALNRYSKKDFEEISINRNMLFLKTE